MSSLEYQTYSDILTARLIVVGFKPSNQESIPDYNVSFGLAADEPKIISSETPVMGRIGGGVSSYQSFRSTPLGLQPQYGTIYTPSVKGVVGTRTEHTAICLSFIRIQIWDLSLTDNSAQLYEGTASIANTENYSFSKSLPIMLDELFENFPGTNASEKQTWFKMKNTR